MTVLNRKLNREVPATVREAGRRRAIILELRPGDPCMWLRQKGTRTRYALPYEVAYVQAVRLEVDRRRREKAKAKKARQ
jgi:hypothetical protein